MPDALPPESLAHAFAEAWTAGDARALAALFEPDAEFVNVVGLWWHSRDAIERAHAYGLARLFPGSALRVTATRTKMLTEAVAVVHARMRLTGQAPIAGVAAPGVRTTVFSFVVRRDAGGAWRCASAHNTDVVGGMETHVRDEAGVLRPADGRADGRPAGDAAGSAPGDADGNPRPEAP